MSGGPWQGRLNPKMGPAGPGQGTQDLSQGQASQEVCRCTALGTLACSRRMWWEVSGRGKGGDGAARCRGDVREAPWGGPAVLAGGTAL